MASLGKAFEGVAGGFLILEAAAGMATNPTDPVASQFGRLARILIGLAMVINALGA